MEDLPVRVLYSVSTLRSASDRRLECMGVARVIMCPFYIPDKDDAEDGTLLM